MLLPCWLLPRAARLFSVTLISSIIFCLRLITFLRQMAEASCLRDAIFVTIFAPIVLS